MNIIKTLFFLLLTVIFVKAENVYSQGFTYVPLGSPNIVRPHVPDSTQVVQIQGIITNTSSSVLNFRFARIVNDLPSTWDTQMCYDLCYAPFVDTISLLEDDPYSIPPGHTDTLFYIDFTCIGEGLGTAVVKMYNTDDPSQFVQNTFTVQVGGVGISNISSLAEGYSLEQNYPNPFNPGTSINFSIPGSQSVSLKVYNTLGNEVSTLVNNQKLSAGTYSVDFNASHLSSGIYYYTLRTENFIDTRKMLLVK